MAFVVKLEARGSCAQSVHVCYRKCADLAPHSCGERSSVRRRKRANLAPKTLALIVDNAQNLRRKSALSCSILPQTRALEALEINMTGNVTLNVHFLPKFTLRLPMRSFRRRRRPPGGAPPRPMAVCFS